MRRRREGGRGAREMVVHERGVEARTAEVVDATVGGERRIFDQSDPSRDPAILLAGFVELRHVGDLEIARWLQIIGPRFVN